MKVHGYCVKCKRIRRVKVSMTSLARLGNGVPIGTCDDCDNPEPNRTR